MSETFNPFSDAYAAAHLADEARSLSSTLLLAPAQESRRVMIVRRWLSQIASELAEFCSGSCDSETTESFETILAWLKTLGGALSKAGHIVPPGTEIVLRAFQQQLFPDGLLIAPTGGVFSQDYLALLTQALEESNLDVPKPPELPSHVFVLKMEYGEEDNVLNGFALVERLYLSMVANAIGYECLVSLRALGPAYLFSTISKYHERPIPKCTAELLAELGWFDHPVLGGLLKDLVQKSAIEDLEDANLSLDTPEWKALCEKIPAYTPEQFDAEVPILWKRLKQLLPPNELGMDEVESENPASLVSILNAGWSFYLLHMEDLYKILGSKTAQDRYDAKMVLNRLLTKGVELSQITQNWRTARKAIGQ